MTIKFNVPLIYGDEQRYINEVFHKGEFCGNSYFSERCEHFLRELVHSPKVLMTSSCTAALEICAILLDLHSGDEVILPSYTHVATASAFSRSGAELVWCDIDSKSLCLDADSLENLITPRTKAIVAVHYAGIPADPEKLLKICRKHQILLIEDAAQSIGVERNNYKAGGFGDLAVMSFHQTKNVHCGEGGAIFINNSAFMEKAQQIRDRGTNREQFNQKKINKWTWVYQGSNYYLSELQAAFLYSQLLHLSEINEKRRNIFKQYQSLLSEFLEPEKYSYFPENCIYNGHLFYILFDAELRHGAISHLKKQGVESVFHYVPLHIAPYWGEKYSKVRLSVTEDIADRIIRLPLHYTITTEEIVYICKKIRELKQL
ncbi:MAG: dTDP-4-amino-4,6-dideoxygalactose transaminase [Candidatus Cloacimonetes bacterium]|nr:dTDP-4-amino-4,6-dideoxygalactose transaminase [Candidatus Cloacimonadota bacterium]